MNQNEEFRGKEAELAFSKLSKSSWNVRDKVSFPLRNEQ